MTDSQRPGGCDRQLEIVALLDERYRLREDPNRRGDLDRTHARLREMLQIPSGHDGKGS